MVRLEALDDGRQVRVGVQLAGGARGALRGWSRSWSQPIVEDRVGVQVPEGAQPDQLVVALPAQRPVLGRGARGSSPPRRRGRRAPRRAPWIARSSRASPAAPSTSSGRRADLGEQPRQVRWRSAARPSATGRPGARPRAAARPRGSAGTPSRRSAMRSIRSDSGAAPRANSENTASPMLAGGRRPPLPAADLVRLEQPEAEVVELEVPLEPRRGREPGWVERLDGREVRPVRVRSRARRLRGPRRPGGGPRCGCRSRWPRSGCRSAGAGPGPRRGRRGGRRAGPRRARPPVAGDPGRREVVGHRSSGAAGDAAPRWALVLSAPRRAPATSSPLGSGRSRAGPRRPRPPPCRRRRPSPRGA